MFFRLFSKKNDEPLKLEVFRIDEPKMPDEIKVIYYNMVVGKRIVGICDLRFGENEELYRLHLSCEYEVHSVGVHAHEDITVNDGGDFAGGVFCRGFSDKVTAPDDDDIKVHDNFSGADVVVLVNHHRDNVRPGGAAPVGEGNADACPAHDAGKHGAHEFVGEQRLMNEVLEYAQQERTHEDGVNRF